jgi:hypothetical protein
MRIKVLRRIIHGNDIKRFGFDVFRSRERSAYTPFLSNARRVVDSCILKTADFLAAFIREGEELSTTEMGPAQAGGADYRSLVSVWYEQRRERLRAVILRVPDEWQVKCRLDRF